MKAIVYPQYGPPEVIQIKEVPRPTPKDHEVLIKIHAATVLAGDCELQSFRFSLLIWLPLRMYVGLRSPKRIPILGQELAGQITLVGKNVTRFQKGDQVFAATESGFGALDTEKGKALEADLIGLVKRFNVATDGTKVVPGDYLEVVVTKK